MIALAFLLAQQTVQIPRAALAKPRPATAWSCDLIDAGGKHFQISGRFDEVPAGGNPYALLPTTISGTAPAYLLGSAYFTPGAFTEAFRDYDVSARGEGGAVSKLSMRLRHGGHGLATLLRLDPPRPYDHIATGLCTSDFALNGKAN